MSHVYWCEACDTHNNPDLVPSHVVGKIVVCQPCYDEILSGDKLVPTDAGVTLQELKDVEAFQWLAEKFEADSFARISYSGHQWRIVLPLTNRQHLSVERGSLLSLIRTAHAASEWTEPDPTPTQRPRTAVCEHGTTDPDNPHDPCMMCAMPTAADAVDDAAENSLDREQPSLVERARIY